MSCYRVMKEPMKTTVKWMVIWMAGAAMAMGQAAPKPMSAAQLAEAYYRKGIAAEQAGNLEGARAAYQNALKANPGHANSTYRLNQLKVTGKDIAARGREARYAKIVVPAIQLDGATLQEAVDALTVLIQKEAKDGLPTNFLIQDPGGKLGGVKITVNLKGVPASAVIKYLMAQANAKVRYEEHAVVIEPKG